MHTVSTLKTAHPLSEHLKSQLHMYSVAAGATGVGLLAIVQPAQGEIVYTPTKVTFGVGILHSYALDLANNGIKDFSLNASWQESIDTSGGTSRLIAKGAAQGDAVVGYGRNAIPLSAGQPIGSARKFKGFLMASMQTLVGSIVRVSGKWPGALNRYLGLKFQINGATHYGWARLSVGINRAQRKLVAVLTGYAYETTPNTPILAGATSGTYDARLVPGSAPGRKVALGLSLGALALGGQSLSIWRREDEKVETQSQTS